MVRWDDFGWDVFWVVDGGLLWWLLVSAVSVVIGVVG